ncbi:MAG: MBL fold metallo-hydrolase, partial [Candidatus Omnitrophica bacterium]|nr:MBL fold metallo-hydrolase [Candidatus Omnitrophota bacterium]
KVKFIDYNIDVIHIPGHTPGGVCLKIGDWLFSGDTLFRSSVGRTDLYKGSQTQILSAIRNKLFVLDDNVRVFPGHGPDTTIGDERNNNPFF